MEPVRFADILFTFLTLAITLAILWGVNRARKQSEDRDPAVEKDNT